MSGDVWAVYNHELDQWYGYGNGGHTSAGHGWGPFERRKEYDAENRESCSLVPGGTWIRIKEATPPTTVKIPGYVNAVYDDGEITSMYFTPLAGDAGYFGPNATLWDGDDDLDIEDSDGPFWRAMQKAIADPDSVPDDSHHLSLSWRE